jgi:hypothetical protein
MAQRTDHGTEDFCPRSSSSLDGNSFASSRMDRIDTFLSSSVWMDFGDPFLFASRPLIHVMIPSDDTACTRGSSRKLSCLSPQARLFLCSLTFLHFLASRRCLLGMILLVTVFFPRESREDFLQGAPPLTLKQILMKNGVLE